MGEEGLGRLVLLLLVCVMWALTHAAWNALMHALWGNTSCRPHEPYTTAVDRRSNYIHPGGPTRSSADSSVPRQSLVLRSGFP